MTDAPERIWTAPHVAGLGDRWYSQRHTPEDVEYLRADLVPRWSDDMDAAPKDGTRVLTFHPANPKAIIERARQDNIVWNEWRNMSWYRSIPEQPPTHWMRVDPPFPASL